MTKPQDVVELERSGQLSAPPVLTRAQVFAHLFAKFHEEPARRYRSVMDIEYVTDLSRVSTAGTILQKVVDELNAVGVKTDPNVESVHRSLGLSREHMHDLACNCLGPDVSGECFAQRLHYMARHAR